MTTVKLNCPKCLSTGLIGNSSVSVCPQCGGTGVIMADDTQTLATVNTTVAAATPAAVTLAVTKSAAIPTAVVSTASKGKS